MNFKVICLFLLLLIPFQFCFPKSVIKVENEKYLNHVVQYYNTETPIDLGKYSFYSYSCVNEALILTMVYSKDGNTHLTSLVLPDRKCTVIKKLPD